MTKIARLRIFSEDEIAQRLGIKSDMVCKWLRRFGLSILNVGRWFKFQVREVSSGFEKA